MYWMEYWEGAFLGGSGSLKSTEKHRIPACMFVLGTAKMAKTVCHVYHYRY